MDLGFPLSFSIYVLFIGYKLNRLQNPHKISQWCCLEDGIKSFKNFGVVLKTTSKSAKPCCREAGLELFDAKTSGLSLSGTSKSKATLLCSLRLPLFYGVGMSLPLELILRSVVG